MKKDPENKTSFSRFILYLALSFILGAVVASVVCGFYNKRAILNISAQIKPLRQKNNRYNFINPLLGYDLPNEVKELDEYRPLKSQIQNSVSQAAIKNLDSYSVYFRDLTLGRWVGINEDTSYAPASMMKVAIMIAYFKEEESSPGILSHMLNYSSSTADQINGVPLETPSSLQVGKNYTVEQLIEAMIISSDNGAKNILLDNIDVKDLDDIYTDLGLPNADDTDNYAISAKQYSVLLRVLYNATYLSRQDSEKSLKIMSQAEFGQGLVAGVPKGVMVAQKFGEHVDTSSQGNNEISLSNCGIIYHPTHPYILCVMTKGSDLKSLQQAIQNISSSVWLGVNSYSLKTDY